MVPLTLLNSGDRAIIDGIRGDETVRKQLLDRGIFPGIQFELFVKSPNEPVILKVHNSRIMIDKETSRRIMVRF